MDHTVEQYQRNLTKQLCCCRDTKDALLTPFRKSLEAYLEVNPEPSMEQLCAAFGPPEAMAAQMMECVKREDAKRYQKQQHRMKTVAGILLAVVLVFAGYVFVEKEYSDIDIVDSGTYEQISCAGDLNLW